jgi:hypothetical protein
VYDCVDRGVKSREEKVSLDGGSLWTQGGTLFFHDKRVRDVQSYCTGCTMFTGKSKIIFSSRLEALSDVS